MTLVFVRIQIVVFDGFDEIDVFGPFEPLALAGVTVELAGAEGAGVVTSARGVQVSAPVALGATRDPEGIIVPGGGWLNRAPRGAWAQVQRGELTREVAAMAERLSWVASVCSGGMILAHAGVLTGRRGTTNRTCFDEFRPLVGELVDQRVVDDGDVITAGALTSGLDLGLHLVRRCCGASTADRVSLSLEYPPA